MPRAESPPSPGGGRDGSPGAQGRGALGQPQVTRVTCPHCNAVLEIDGEVSTVMCGVCLRKFNASSRKTVACPRCGADLAVPPKARVLRCGGCGARVELEEGDAAPPDSQALLHTETSFVLSDSADEPPVQSETSAISQSGVLVEQRMEGMREEFDEKYEVLESLGHGGMGAIYKARQKKPPRIVVLKVMLNGRFASDKYRTRFEREAQAVARLKHPNIVGVYEFGEVKGQPYFTMEFVDGCSVREYVIRHQLEKRPICEIMRKICAAAAYAHQRGVIHRDIKPNNILVDGQGSPRLLDFGLARLAGDYTEEEPHMTEAGEVMGTPSYMSPEQTLGRPEEIDIRTDVYSIGVLFYELLTDTLPYRIDRARPLESLRTIREYVPKRPSEINPKIDGDLDAIVMKCLEKERELRYQSAVELSEDIGRYLRGKPVEARPSTSFYRLRKLIWRHRNVLMPMAVALLLLLAMGGVFIRSLAMAGESARTQVQDAERESEELLQKQRELKQFIGDMQAVRRRVDDLFHAGRWEDAYRMACFAERELGAEMGYGGFQDEIRRTIGDVAGRRAEQIAMLVEQLRFSEARQELRELKQLADELELGELRNTLDRTERDFDESCWQSVTARIKDKEGTARALRSFLAECPNSTYAVNARTALDKIRHELRFTQWPFSAEEAGLRQARTAALLDVGVESERSLEGGGVLPLVLVPAGEFMMGSPGEGVGFSPDQRPAHRVRITNPFYLSATEVTRAQFASVTGRLLPGDGNLPACVSWEEAQLFCTQLSREIRLTARLPTEAEWEYACRAGSADGFSYGDDTEAALLPEYAWYKGNSDRQPQRVGLKKPNAWGLYDVHGNVLEWCRDWYDARYYLSSPVVDPQGPDTGTYKVLRGGGWAHDAGELVCSNREAAQPDAVGQSYGFRVHIELELFTDLAESAVAGYSLLPSVAAGQQ